MPPLPPICPPPALCTLTCVVAPSPNLALRTWTWYAGPTRSLRMATSAAFGPVCYSSWPVGRSSHIHAKECDSDLFPGRASKTSRTTLSETCHAAHAFDSLVRHKIETSKRANLKVEFVSPCVRINQKTSFRLLSFRGHAPRLARTPVTRSRTQASSSLPRSRSLFFVPSCLLDLCPLSSLSLALAATHAQIRISF